MFKWTTYDGTPDTLPPHGVEVLGVYTPFDGGKDITTCVTRAWLDLNVRGWCKLRWMYIPTQQQCEAWEKAKVALEFYAEPVTQHSYIENNLIVIDSGEVARGALAAIEAAEKEVMPNDSP